MYVFYAHMIGVKFYHIKIWKVELLGTENWSTMQNVQNGSYNVDPASWRWLQNTDLSSDDTWTIAFKLEAGEPLGLCTNRKGVTFLNSWHLSCYLFAHLKQKQKQKVLKINKYPGASSIRACSDGVVWGLHPLQLWIPHSRAALTSSPWQQRKQISFWILKSRPAPLNLI